MFIALINFIVNAFLFMVIYFIKNRLVDFKDIDILNEQKVKSSYFILSLTVMLAGLAWFIAGLDWLNVLVSLLGLTAMSVFFNSVRQWFKKSQHKKIKREGLVSLGIWLLWLLSGSIFLANIILLLFN